MATEGYKQPSPDPIEALMPVRSAVSEITGIESSLVRRRYQPNPPTQPGAGANWCSLSIDGVRTIGTPEIKETLSKSDTAEARILQELSFIASFYGPEAMALAETFRAGITMPFNACEMRQCGLGIMYVDPDTIRAPDFVNGRWVDRWDVRFKVGRMAYRSFSVRTLEAAGFVIISDTRGVVANG